MIFKFFTAIILIEEILTQNCQLNATHMDKRWIYATKWTASTWDVLHTNYIPDSMSVYMLCNTMAAGREIFCNRGQLQERNTTNPTQTCGRRIRAETVLMANENSCRRQNGELYQVRYTLANSSIVPLYEVCYSKLNEQTLYSRHKTYGFNLAATTYRRPLFSRGRVVSRQRERSFEVANIYETFIRLLGPKQTYIPNNKTLILDRGHLVNSQDFPTYDQMDETFKYINVIPQFRGSNRSNWKRIENWVHNLPSANTYAEVVTGCYETLNLPHSERDELIPIYLMANGKNPIPLWSYKVVKYDGRCYAFISLNNDFNTNPNYNTSICSSVACPTGLQFNTGRSSGISYCCNYNYFVRHIGRHAVLC